LIDLIRNSPGAREALLEPERRRSLRFSELNGVVDDLAARLAAVAGGRVLVFLAMGPGIDAVVLYLACLRARLPVCLAEAHAEPLARLVATYAPGLLLLPATLGAPPGYVALAESGIGDEYRAWRRERGEVTELHPDLALLLTTSGSTGSPKLVRLTVRNLESNALAIGEYLGLSPDERAVQSLPSHYSYGLSVLNSHLAAGGSVVLTPHSFMRPEFWNVVDEHACTSFAGVPYMYETLHRLRYAPARHAGVRTYTQAGGGLRHELIAHYHRVTSAAHARFYVMYGQTEAAPRISYVPPERLGEKIGSIGMPIPGGALSLSPVADSDGMEELVYRGPNVMMGYAETSADLALGDVQGGVLRTGDLGRVDGEGYYSVVGRLKRFAKLFGSRVSLEDVERELETHFPVRAAALDGRDRVLLYVAGEGAVEGEAMTGHIAHYLGVPPKAVILRRVESLPLTASGKKNYKALEAQE
jgi:acyl-CoA synthetase (AMP-forming)/AMP-acid ligase II